MMLLGIVISIDRRYLSRAISESNNRISILLSVTALISWSVHCEFRQILIFLVVSIDRRYLSRTISGSN